jgi:hypothetical protein
MVRRISYVKPMTSIGETITAAAVSAWGKKSAAHLGTTIPCLFLCLGIK